MIHKTCECGCGEPVRAGCHWRRGHYWRGRTRAKANHWKGGVTAGEPGCNRGRTYVPGHPWAVRAGTVYIPSEMAVAEMALGYCLLEPPRWSMFFLDGDRTNLDHENLVVCQDRQYAEDLKRRLRALRACGHVGWRRCRACEEWGPPEEIRADLMHRAGFGCKKR